MLCHCNVTSQLASCENRFAIWCFRQAYSELGIQKSPHTNVRILQTMVSGFPLAWGLSTRMWDPYVYMVFGLLITWRHVRARSAAKGAADYRGCNSHGLRTSRHCRNKTACRTVPGCAQQRSSLSNQDSKLQASPSQTSSVPES